MANVAKEFSRPELFSLSPALKEWAVAIEALCQGTLILLFRKGGIREPQHSFSVQRRAMLLFPTVEHQKRSALKPDYSGLLSDLPQGDHAVWIRAWAEITHQASLTTLEQVEALHDWHIWTADFMRERFLWRSPQPLQLLCLRTYHIAQPAVFPTVPAFRGCRSWVELQPPLPVDRQHPALETRDYQQRLDAIAQLLHQTSSALEPLAIAN